jgi:hypothetical protein
MMRYEVQPKLFTIDHAKSIPGLLRRRGSQFSSTDNRRPPSPARDRVRHLRVVTFFTNRRARKIARGENAALESQKFARGQKSWPFINVFRRQNTWTGSTALNQRAALLVKSYEADCFLTDTTRHEARCAFLNNGSHKWRS